MWSISRWSVSGQVGLVQLRSRAARATWSGRGMWRGAAGGGGVGRSGDVAGRAGDGEDVDAVVYDDVEEVLAHELAGPVDVDRSDAGDLAGLAGGDVAPTQRDGIDQHAGPPQPGRRSRTGPALIVI